MKLLFVHDHIFYKTKENQVYSAAAYPIYAWDRYLEFFDTIDVVGRYGGLYDSRENSLVLSSRENVNFHFVDNIASPIKLIKNKTKVKNEIKKLLNASDALVVRLPSENGLIAIQCAKELGRPYAVEVVGCVWDALWNHGSILAKLYAPYSFLKMRKAVSSSDMNLYVTEKFLQKRYPSNVKAVSINASNVEISVDENLHTKKFDKTKKKVFGLIGNYKTRYKGLHIAIEAFGNIKEQIGDFEFRILGKGNSNDYKELIEKYSLEKNVIFSGSLPNGDAVLNWLDEIDFYLQPSLQEGLPRATIEAMSRACVCVGSDTGGIPELLNDEFVSKAGCSESLSKVIINTLNESNEELEKISKMNYEKSKQYDKSYIHKTRSEFYGKLYEKAKV